MRKSIGVPIKSPQQILAEKQIANTAQAEQLTDLIAKEIADPSRGFSGEPWRYYIDTNQYSEAVVVLVRSAFHQAGWAMRYVHSTDQRDHGYELEFTAKGGEG